MADTYLQMPLTQMVDLVINSPEEGVVNFNLLHTVLRVLVKQIKAEDISVELHGTNAKRLENIIKNGTIQTVNITEIPATKKVDDGTGTTAAKKVDDATATGTTKKVDDGTSALEGGKKDAGMGTIFVVEQMDSGKPGGMAVTKNQLDSLHTEVEELKQKLTELTDLPANLGIIDAVRTETGSPVVDMFQLLTLSKRVDAAEIGMNKLASIVEDLIKSPVPRKSGICEKAKKAKSRPSVTVTKESSRTDFEPTQLAMTFDLSTRLNNMALDEQVAYLCAEVIKIKKFFDGEEEEEGDDQTDKMSFADMMKTVKTLRNKFLTEKRKSRRESDTDLDDDTNKNLPPDVQLVLLEERFRDYTLHLDQMDQCFNDEISKLHNQFTDIEKDFNEILVKIEGGLPAGDRDEPGQCCAAVYHNIVKLQAEFELLAESTAKLLEDKEEKQKRMDELLEQVELLKTIKADKEDIEEALADKADACTVHRKVSHDQFDSACDELSKGIGEALAKLTQQESLWQQALDDIQNEIGNKLDKMDLSPLREFINNKLKMLQEKMKSLAALKKEQEAAGTKTKFLRNVNCISCDKDVVMRKEMDSTLRPPAYNAPPSRSMGPYLAYELDSLRKQQKGIPGSKNLNYMEAAVSGKGVKKSDDHICNRYCGGSHTLTTPQQRVTRLGHFLMQWGPEAIPQEESKPETEKRTSIMKPSVVSQPEAVDIGTGRKSATLSDPKIRKSTSGAKLSQQPSIVKTGSGKMSVESVDKRKSDVKRSNQSLQKRTSAKSRSGGIIAEETGDQGAPEEAAAADAAPEEQPPAEGDGGEAAPAEAVEETGGEAPPPEEAAPPAEEPPAEAPAETTE